MVTERVAIGCDIVTIHGEHPRNGRPPQTLWKVCSIPLLANIKGHTSRLLTVF